MYPRDAIPRLIAMAKTGLLNLQRYRIAEFPLAEVGAAIEHAAATSGAFNRTALRF